MYAKIASTTWRSDQPARSTLEGCDGEFEHELGCTLQGEPPQRSYVHCTCYVSRIRLVPTPVGDWLPTTDPDLAPQLVFWEKSARIWKRAAYICTGVAGLSMIISVGNVLGWF